MDHEDNNHQKTAMSRRAQMKAGTVAAAAVAGVGAAAVMSAPVGASGGGKEFNLRVTADFGSFVAPHGVPGPFFVGGDIFPKSGGPTLGKFQCWGWLIGPTDADPAMVTQEYDLGPRGKILVAGIETDAPRAVTGGTGDFATARGDGKPSGARIGRRQRLHDRLQPHRSARRSNHIVPLGPPITARDKRGEAEDRHGLIGGTTRLNCAEIPDVGDTGRRQAEETDYRSTCRAITIRWIWLVPSLGRTAAPRSRSSCMARRRERYWSRGGAQFARYARYQRIADQTGRNVLSGSDPAAVGAHGLAGYDR